MRTSRGYGAAWSSPSRSRLWLVPVLAMVAGAGLASVAAAEVTSPPGTDLGTLGGNAVEVTDVDGEVVVGWSNLPGDFFHAFAYDLRAGSMRDVGTLGGRMSRAYAVDGRTVVGASESADRRRHAFAYDLRAGSMRDLGTLGGPTSLAVDVDAGTVVGWSDVPGGGTRAFSYDLRARRMRDLGSLGFGRSAAVAVDGGVVVGWSSVADARSPDGVGSHAFAYDLSAENPTMRDLGTLGGHRSEAVAVDGDTVVGWSHLADNRTVHAFAYDLGAANPTMRDLGTLGGLTSQAVDVAGDTVVGSSFTTDNADDNAEHHAFAYDLNTGAMRDLGTLSADHSDSAALAVDGDIVVGLSGFGKDTSELDDFGQGTAVAFDLRHDSVVALGTPRPGDESTPVAVSGGVVAGYADDRLSDEEGGWRWLGRHPVAWSLGVGFARPVVRVTEDAGTASLVVRRGGDTTTPATVDYARTAGTATPGADFTLEPGSLTFAAGESTKTIGLAVADDAGREAAETVMVSLTPRDAGTLTGAPTSLRVVIAPSDQRPDGRISTRRSSGFVGANVFNTTGAHQTRRRSAARGHERSFYVRVGNHGNVRNTFVLTGSRPARGSRVRYFVGGRDVTAALRSPEGLRTTRRPGAYTRVRIRVKVRGTAAVGSTKPARVTATWTGDRQRSDTVRAVVRVVRPRRG